MHTGVRTRRAKLYRAQQGKWCGGTPPYGYSSQGTWERSLKRAGVPKGEAMQPAVKMCPERGKLYLVPDEAFVVKEIFALFIRLDSLRKTVTTLNKAGKRTRQGQHWTLTSMHNILKNPLYIGKMRLGVRPVGMDGKRYRAKKSEWVLVDGEHEAILGEEVFNDVQRMLPQNPTKPKKSEHIYLFSGVLKCGYCGGSMAGQRQNRRGKYTMSYKCTRNAQQGKSGCEGQRWRADKLEAQVIESLKGLAEDRDFLEDARNHVQDVKHFLKTHDVEPELNRLNKDIRTCQQRIDTLLDKLHVVMQKNIS